ncbi:Late embryogenesis abundant protein Lea5-like protein [Drosera capensis]
MARSLFNAKLLSALVADNLSLALTRRGYAAASLGVSKSGGVSGVTMGKEEEKSARKGVGEKSWVLDPVTGYYRPGNTTMEIDAVDLRNMMITNKRH